MDFIILSLFLCLSVSLSFGHDCFMVAKTEFVVSTAQV